MEGNRLCKFRANSHVLSLLYTHLAHTDCLNETCDALRVHESEFMRTCGATPPARNVTPETASFAS